MASISSGNHSPFWLVYFQPLISAIILALIVGFFSIRDTANTAYAGVQDQAKRIEALETAAIQISVLNAKVDAQRAQIDRLETKIDRLTDYQIKRGGK